MRKKFTMLLASLFLTLGTAWAENVLFNANSTTALPGTSENSQYTWKSSEMTAPDGFTTLRLTFMKTTNNAMDPGGHPHVNIAEFYLYDKDGNTVTLTSDRFSSNATETNEGKSGLHRLCDGTYTKQEGDGNNDWYWHSFWSSNPGAYHYLEINVADVGADLSTFAVGYVTRQENGSPTELLVTTGSSTEDVAAQCPNVTVTYNHLLGGVSKKTEARDAVVGASYPAPSLPWGVKVVTDLSGTVTEGGTKDIEVAYNGELPFTPSASFETAHWHYLRFTKDARYIRYNESDTYIPTDIDKIYPNVDPEAYAWAFVGDPYTGEYKLMNRKAGSTKVLSSTRNVYDGNTGANTCPLMKEESGINETTDNKTWIVTKSTSIAGVNGMFIGLKTSNNETKYMNNRSKLAFWTGGQGDGSTFQTEEFSYQPAFVVAKEEALKSLQALAAISDKTEAAKTAIEALDPATSEEALAAFTTLNEQMNSVVSGEYFTLQNKNNTSIYLTTDGTNASATTTVDIKVYWTLKNKNGLFYLYNKYNNAYLQAIPNANETKTTITDKENLAAAYKAVLPVNDKNNVWALTSFIGAGNGDQCFLHKAGDNRIVRWTATAEASQWTITEVDYAAAFSALVDAQLDGKVFSDNPALGEYPTSAKDAFDALKAAYLANPTDENERALVDGFDELEKAKNLPVFTIDGIIGYAKGTSIYDNPSSTNGKGNTHYFKATYEFDKTMWWALDLTAVDLTDSKINSPKLSVGIYNVGTGAGFWGASTIDITETSENDATDDIFLFYANGGDPIHAQKDGALITKWESKGKDSGSAWKFSYIGSTFELSKYDDDYAAAYAALETAYIAKRDWLNLFGDGVGQYSGGDSESFLTPLTTGTEMLTVKLSALLEHYDTQDIVDATTAITAMQETDILTNQNFTLNLPTVGKYYRIKGANTGAENYVTGYLRTAGDRIALQAKANGATVFQYLTKDNGDGILLAVENNLYLALNSWTFKLKKADAAKTEFAASTRKAGAYTIKSGGTFFHYDNGFLNRCGNDADHTAHDWHLEEVDESEVPANTNLLTDIKNLSAEASYRIYGDRGFIYVADDGNMKGTNRADVAYNPNNNKHHFAIVTIDKNKYLYNVGAKKFVMKKDNVVALTDYPEQAVTIVTKDNADQNSGYDWVIKFGDNRMNLSDSGTYGVYTNYNTEDGGNVWAIYKVGSFAPAEAQSMKKVIVNYTIDGVAATETLGVAASSTLNFSYEFATVTSCKVGEEAQTVTDGACSVTIQDNVTISVAITSDNRLFRLKNTVSSKYMTIVTPEAAEGVQIKDKADDPVKQAFRIVLANWQGKYNIKSTENYFMASSGAWHYGAYETANENGRTHNVENLGEGKYGLKTLNGYAGPNSGVTADGSPLYSNHGAGNSGREWELEELPKSSITYTYKWNDQTIESEVHENVYEGLAAPATAVTLPFGFSYDAATLPTTKGAGNEEVEITCTLSLPFQYAATYQAIEENGYWYYLKFDSDNNFYLHHAAGQDHIALDSKAVDKKNKDVYSWGFVGDPINGYKIVNKAAGSTMILSSSTTMTGTTGDGTWPIMTVAEGLAEGNNTYWIPTASTHATNGFFLAQKGFPENRLNNRGKLAYWTGGVGSGSTFVVEARPFGPVAELEALIAEAEVLNTAVAENVGTIIGKYTQETANALSEAIIAAQAKVDDATATAADAETLQNAMDAVKVILPTPGTYYQFHSADQHFTETRALYSNGTNARWQVLNNADKSFYWLAEATTDGNIVLKNAKDNKYLHGNTETSGNWSMAETNEGAEMNVKILGEAEGTVEYAIILSGRHMHAANFDNGNARESNIVSWETNATNSCSSWHIVEAELPSFYPVTYKFNYNGDTKYTQEKLVAVGGAYPAMDVFLPYGVTSNFELPAGTVQAASEHEFVLTVNKALPLEAAADVNSITKWYYVQMHANPTVTAYLEDNNGTNIAWNNKFVEDSKIESHLWGFVGDVWTGIKVVNKATNKAIVSTSGNAVLGDAANATAFIPTISNGVLSDWFCLKYPESNYLNAQGNQDEGQGIVASYDEADNGSSFFVTEYEKSYTLNLGTGYATFYSQYRVAIPEGVEAWVVSSIENNEVVLDEVEGDILPANTGVILTGTGEDLSIVTSAAETANVGTNLLRGTVTKTLIEAAANTSYYVLANGVNGVKLYKAKVNKNAEGTDGNTHFYNNANKVYLPVEIAEPQAAQALAFRFRGKEQGTTEIEVPATNDQQPAVIYDLTGRRIEKIVEKGIYIVNGKKVVIK